MKTTNEILEMVEQYKEAAQLIEMAQAEQEKLKSEIKAVAPDLYEQYSKTVTGQRLTVN